MMREACVFVRCIIIRYGLLRILFYFPFRTRPLCRSLMMRAVVYTHTASITLVVIVTLILPGDVGVVEARGRPGGIS